MMPRRRVLIVDDDRLLRVATRAMLEAADLQVFEAADGPEGLALAAEQQPDAILLDLMMPGIDGYETCQGLKAHPLTRDIPVIIYTANYDVGLTHRAYAVGAVACIPKPSRDTSLLATLHAALATTRRAGVPSTP